MFDVDAVFPECKFIVFGVGRPAGVHKQGNAKFGVFVLVTPFQEIEWNGSEEFDHGASLAFPNLFSLYHSAIAGTHSSKCGQSNSQSC